MLEEPTSFSQKLKTFLDQNIPTPQAVKPFSIR
jgi:hypothetical protein